MRVIKVNAVVQDAGHGKCAGNIESPRSATLRKQQRRQVNGRQT